VAVAGSSTPELVTGVPRDHAKRVLGHSQPGVEGVYDQGPLCGTRTSGMLLPGSPDDFRKLIAEEVEKWGKVIHAANIKQE